MTTKSLTASKTKKEKPSRYRRKLSVEQYRFRCSTAVHGYIRNTYKDTPSEITELISTFYYFDDRFINVFCRFRPQNQRERLKNGIDVIEISENNSLVTISDHSIHNRHKTFTFDYIFSQSSSQSQVYSHIGPQFIHSIFSGYNTSILCYGQTGAGKTYTIEGEISNGFMPRIIETIFEHINASNDNIVCTVKASCIEIYMQKIKDLLIGEPNSSDERPRIRERQSDNGGREIYIQNNTEKIVQTASELLELFACAQRNRLIAATHMGRSRSSSRSYAIYMLELTQMNKVNGETLVSKIKFCDLCGSEGIKKIGANGQILREAARIQLSLNAFGHVISALTSGKKHIPYRDSAVTRLLREELGGNCNTFMIINCSPSSCNVTETVSSCRFGSRMKQIVNCAGVNKL